MKLSDKMFRAVAVAATAVVVAAGAVVGGSAAVAAEGDLSGVAPIEQRNERTVTADALPTVQLDGGIVWTQVMNGNVVYAGGSFSQTRPAGAAPGTNRTPRSNLLAYDVRTGNLLPFAPQINGTVKSLAVSPDGRTLYVGGSFTKVGNDTRWNVAAFDTATGALSTTFKPAVGGSYVNAIVATSSVVYFGGLIGATGGVTRQNLSAVSASNGQLLGWAPTTDLQVDSMVMAPGGGKLIVAGRFAKVNSVTQRGLAALDLADGSLLPWAVTNTVKNGQNNGGNNSGKAGIWAVTADAENVYGTGWVYADINTGNLEGLFAAEGQSGDIVWIADCHGDHYGVFSDGVNVYSTGHEHECTTAGGLPQGNGTMRNATVYTAERKGTLTRSPYVNSIYADWSGYPAPAAVNWFPDWLTGTASGMGQAGWTITGNDDYVVFGGEFVGVNNLTQQGLVRFARSPQGGASQGPRLTGSAWAPTGTKSLLPGTLTVAIGANWDRDDRDLTYELWEDGKSTPSGSTTVASTFWNLPSVNVVATGLEPGSTHTFRVRVKDGDGNSVTSSPITGTVTNQLPSAYADQVLGDSPSIYWRLNQGALGADWAGSRDAVVGSGVTSVTDSPLTGESGSAKFNGSTSNGTAATATTIPAPSQFSLELWFKASSGTSGKLVGYGNARTGNSSSYDRHVYLTSSGQVIFGTYPGAVRTIASQGGRSYADAQWHHVVASQGAGGMALYIDGSLVSTDPSTTTAEGYTGYWRIGGDNLSSWPSAPSGYYNGQLDEVAIYSSVLTSQQVAQHYAVATGAGTPTAAFEIAGDGFERSFDASSSTASSGQTLTGYSWNFGDGSPAATGVTTTHTYAAAGTYNVTLTVTDNRGLVSTKTLPVTVTAPHEAPTAVIGHEADGLTVAFDSGDSTAMDGSVIEGYAWDFGDGETSSEATPTHTYASAGTYSVTLVVTDDTGAASEPAEADVVVEHADPTAAFDVSATGPTVTVDASGSSASDGATLSYAWNWGDETASGSGKNASHTYDEAGVYTVELTVTDSLGATASITHEVEVFAEVFLARDTFERNSASNWGTADIGGTWSGTAGFSVADGSGQISVGKSQTRRATLDGAETSEFDMSLVFSADRVADGGGIHFNVAGHSDASGEYRAKLRISAAGTIIVNLATYIGTTETLIAARTLTDAYTAGEQLNIRFSAAQVTASRTDLKVKVWPVGSAEPEAWTTTAASTEGTLQGVGKFGIGAYGTGTITNGPVTISVDDIVVRGVGQPAAHVAPVAKISAEKDSLRVDFDGTGSTTSDGATISSYAWSFGDGSTSTEAKPTHTYDEAGAYDVSLTVTDSFGVSSAVATTSVSVAHTDPVARFSESRSELTVNVDGSDSTASDGATLEYGWSWGDGTADSEGVDASHTYAEAGSYVITLTVTDSLGGSATTSKTVAVSAESFVAKDDFQRTVASGWGSAATGGAWTVSAGTFSVADGAGQITVGKSQTRTAVLSGVSAEDVDARLTFSTDKVADGGGLHVNYAVRKSASNEYRAKLRISAAGVVAVSVAKVVDGTETLVANRNLADYTYTADAKLNVRLQTVSEGSSTLVRVKVWADGTDEPSSWTVSATDSTAALQDAGQIAVSSYVTGTTTNGPVVVSFHDLSVQ